MRRFSVFTVASGALLAAKWSLVCLTVIGMTIAIANVAAIIGPQIAYILRY